MHSGGNVKKQEHKFTIQLNSADPHHQKAIDILNRQGRHKGQFIVNAILHYMNCTAEQTTSDNTINYTAIEEIVAKVMREKYDFGNGNIREKESFHNIDEKSDTIPTDNEKSDTMNDETMQGIMNSLGTFRRKNK